MAQAAAAALAARLEQALLVPEVQVEAVVPSAKSCSRARKCLQPIPQAWFLLALAQVERLVHPLPMRALQTATTVAKAGTLRLARWAPPTVAAAEVLVLAPQVDALAALAEVRGQKVRAEAIQL